MPQAARLLELSDVEELTELLRVNRNFLAPWSPAWDDEFFTVERQRELAQDALGLHQAGSMVPWVICDERGLIAGRLNLNGIVRGALQSAAGLLGGGAVQRPGTGRPCRR